MLSTKRYLLIYLILFSCVYTQHAMHHAWSCLILTDARAEPNSPQISTPTTASPASVTTSEPASPFSHSNHLPFKYARRVLDWHDNPRTALRTQGYYKPYIPEIARIKCITRHRIPFVIEQYYRKLAIPLPRQRLSDPDDKPYETLNFPGAIELPNGLIEVGAFAIGFDPTNHHEIFHRCFHTNNLAPQLIQALDYHTYATRLFSDEINANLVAIDLAPDYLIAENDYIVRIAKRTKPNTTYILYKSHITLPNMPFINELFKKNKKH